MKNKSLSILIPVGIVIALIVIVLVMQPKQNNEDVATATTQETTQPTTKEQSTTKEQKTTAQEKTTSPVKNLYGPGTYKVGKDIPAGDYILVSNNTSYKAYFSVYKDANKNNIQFNDGFGVNRLITVYDGEYLELTRCTAFELQEFREYYTVQTTKDDCMFEVGVDVAPGEYKVMATNSSKKGYYCIYDDMRQSNIIANDVFDNSTYCDIKEGQYILLKDCVLFIRPSEKE